MKPCCNFQISPGVKAFNPQLPAEVGGSGSYEFSYFPFSVRHHSLLTAHRPGRSVLLSSLANPAEQIASGIGWSSER